MARPPKSKDVDSLRHQDRRVNNPTAEMAPVYEQAEEQMGLKWKAMRLPRAFPLAEGETRPRDADLDPQIVWNGVRITLTEAQRRQLQETGTVEIGDAQLVWRGKDTQDWSDLIVNAPPLYIQEKVHPKAIIDDLKRRSDAARAEEGGAPDLFADFNGLTDPEEEAREALLEYATTGQLTRAAPPSGDPLQHPDTQRRFRVMEGVEEMQRALDAPFEKWAVFLHPSQRATVERAWSGPARVVGSAGTGKTVVALHRVLRILQAEPDARVLLTTFSDPLSRALAAKLRLLLGERSALLDRVTIAAFDRVAAQLYMLATGQKPNMAPAQAIRSQLRKAADEADVSEVSSQFLHSEWDNVIDPWQLDSLEAYAAVPRVGRKNRLGPKQRERLWQVFAAVRNHLAARRLFTDASLFAETAALFRDREPKPFTHIVVDEAQDLGVAELRFLAAIAADRPDALFFAGDLGQRIFRQPFSWKGLGVDVRGRSVTLKVNYRTSHQIRRAADRLLPRTVRDLDGLADERAGTISVFEGPEPEVHVCASQQEERERAAAVLSEAIAAGVSPAEIGVFVRSEAQLGRARAAVRTAGLESRGLIDPARDEADTVLVGTMHLAKGLEFRMVLLMACDQDVLPLAERVEQVADEFELDEVLTTERQLLYVAATRARDRLVITAAEPASEFIDDLLSAG